jgi:predicted Zn-dependent protease
MKRGVHGLDKGFNAGGSVGTLLLHELGHAVGLRHVSDDSQVMYPVIGKTSPAGYAAGDRTGLAKVGRGAGCMHTPRLPAINKL